MRPERFGPCWAAGQPSPATSGLVSPMNTWSLSSGTGAPKGSPYTRKPVFFQFQNLSRVSNI